MNSRSAHLKAAALQMLARLSPRQRQYAMLTAILIGGVGLLWAILATSDSGPPSTARKPASTPGTVTNLGVMPPGQQVNPVDQWVGTAGSKLAQYERERDEQGRLNRDRQDFEHRTMQRFADLEQRLTSAANASLNGPAPTGTPPAGSARPADQALAAPAQAMHLPPPPAPAPTTMPPAHALPLPPIAGPSAGPAARPFGETMPGGMTTALGPLGAVPAGPPPLTRVTLSDPAAARPHHVATPGLAEPTDPAGPTAARPPAAEQRTVSTFLPVSFTRGTLLGGLDAPTGGQSQSNPQPVLIRLSDNSVLPNQFRGEYRDCFVIAAGYGDISSERAYLRTESLSCVRADGAALEVRIQGSVYGEDGKVGMRGRLVTKQGQMLANALMAGVVGGIGQGLANSSTTVTTTPLGTLSSADGQGAYRAGVGTGVGRALDRLAQYYIKLAENTFPVIEVDAGREIDVVITKGVRIDVPMAAAAEAPPHAHPAQRTQEAHADVDD
jgi:conjugal transfer pilus assembly protein TraB